MGVFCPYICHCATYAYALCIFKYMGTYVSISGSQRLKSDVSFNNSPYIFIFWKGLFWAQNFLILLDLLDSFSLGSPVSDFQPQCLWGVLCPLAFLRAPGIQSPVLMLVSHKLYKKSHLAGSHIVLETQFLTRNWEPVAHWLSSSGWSESPSSLDWDYQCMPLCLAVHEGERVLCSVVNTVGTQPSL